LVPRNALVLSGLANFRVVGHSGVNYKRDSGKLEGKWPKSLKKMTQLLGEGTILLEIGDQAQKAAFQIRSSWAQFHGIVRFWRVAKSITYVFSTSMNIPTPPASTISGAVLND
jgi:hypothetical protein